MQRTKGLKKTHVFEVVIKHCPETRGPYKYAVEVPALPGCLSDGRTAEEALKNVREAIALYLAARKEQLRKNVRLVEVTV